MNREITPEIREKIFCLYYGQEILQHQTFDAIILSSTVIPLARQRAYHLLLKDLKDITDEDAIKIATLATSWDDESPLSPEDVPEWLHEVMTGNCATYADYVSGEKMIQLIDLLRALGISTDAYGFTVQELIDAKIYKIRSKE